MAIASYRIMVQIDWPNTDLITRLWSGSGAVLDADMNVWKGVGLVQGLDVLESVMNGEASTVSLTLSGVSAADSQPLYLMYTEDQMIDADVRFMIQPCDERNRPEGEPETIFRGNIDNVIFKHVVTSEDTQEATILAEITNRFAMRRLTHGGVYSSADQIPYAKLLNPSGNPDRMCERTYEMEDVTITYPRWS